MGDILENATIIFKDGSKELCEAISISENGVYTGRIKSINENKTHLINHSFIPKDQIKRIFICNEHGRPMDIDFE